MSFQIRFGGEIQPPMSLNGATLENGVNAVQLALNLSNLEVTVSDCRLLKSVFQVFYLLSQLNWKTFLGIHGMQKSRNQNCSSRTQ